MDWNATTGVIEDRMYQALARKYAFDPQAHRWLQEVPPHALPHLAQKLLEAAARGRWRADPQTRSRREEILLAGEGEAEEVLE